MLEAYTTRVLPFQWNPALNVLDSTKVNCFLDCPRQFFYRYLLGWELDRPNNHLVFGSAWHEAMEHIMLNEYSEETVMDAFTKFMEIYREEFPEETDELFVPKTPENALQALMAYIQHYQNDSFKTLHTEISGRISVDGERALAFRMDSVCENLDESIFSLEHKTKGGAFSRVWNDQWPLSLQVGAYSHVLHCLAIDRPVRGVIINGVSLAKAVRSNPPVKIDFQRIPVYRSPVHVQNWLFHINHYFDQIENEMLQLWENCSPNQDVFTAFPQNPGSCTKYFGCQYFDFCNAWPNPLKRCDEVPPGYTIRHWNPLEIPGKTILDV